MTSLLEDLLDRLFQNVSKMVEGLTRCTKILTLTI